MSTTIIRDFDDKDVLILAQRFTFRELLHEAECAKAELSASEWLGDDQADYWHDFFVTAALAADIRRRFERTTKPKTVRPVHIDVEAVKAHADIVEVVSRYTTLRKSGKNFSGLCPLHADKKSRSLYVYPDQQSWHCFGACGTGGDVINFVMKAEHTDFRGAVGVLNG